MHHAGTLLTTPTPRERLPQDYVRGVHLADVPREVRQVARDAQVAALPRIDA
jgi:hypothetical protein